MSTDFEVPQQWVKDLMQKIVADFNDEYKQKAQWSYDADTLYLNFPNIPRDQLDRKQIDQALQKYRGAETKEYFLFNKPVPQPLPTSVPIVQVVPVLQSPIPPSDNKSSSSEVNQNMSMTMEKYLESNSNYVSLKNCKVGDVFTIMEKPQFIESEFEGKKRTQLVATVLKENPNGENLDMKMSINKTNAQTLVDNWGSDVSIWVGRKVFIATKQKYNNGKEGFIIVPKQ